MRLPKPNSIDGLNNRNVLYHDRVPTVLVYYYIFEHFSSYFEMFENSNTIILIISGFHICESAYLLIFIFNLEVSTLGLRPSFMEMWGMVQHVISLLHRVPTEMEQADTLSSYFNYHIVNK